MAKSSKQYWTDRTRAEKAAMEAVGGIVAREQVMAKKQKAIFNEAARQLDEELDALRKDVGDDEISRAKMQEPLTPKQLSDWSNRQQQRLESLISEFGDEKGRQIFGQENAKTGKRDRASRIVRRQEALKGSIEAISSQAAARSEEVTKKALKEEAKLGADAFKKQFNAETQVKFNTVSNDELDRVINTDWKGGNYSDRIWIDRDEMVKDLERAVNLGVSNGWSIPRMAQEMKQHVKKGRQSAERIARTEMNRVSNEAERVYYEANGIHYYRFIATEDARTCEYCGKLNDKVFSVEDAVTGDNFPPVHPNCRCRTVGSFVDESGKEDDDWLDELIDEAEEEIDEDEIDEDEGEDVATTSKMASKTLVEDGTVLPKIDHKAEYNAIQQECKQDAELDDFINSHVETHEWQSDDYGRVPRLSVLKEAQQLYSNYLEDRLETNELEFHFGHPNHEAFDRDCKRAFGSEADGEQFKDAGGAFGYSDEGYPVLIVRSTITLDGLRHEIGHAIHSQYLDANESKDQFLTVAVEKVWKTDNPKFIPYGVDRSDPLIDAPKRGFEVELLKALTGKSRFGSVDEYKADASKYAGLLTAFHNINAIVRNSNQRGIHWGKEENEVDDEGWKELFANASTIYLSGNQKAANFLGRHYKPIAEYVKTRIDQSRRSKL